MKTAKQLAREVAAQLKLSPGDTLRLNEEAEEFDRRRTSDLDDRIREIEMAKRDRPSSRLLGALGLLQACVQQERLAEVSPGIELLPLAGYEDSERAELERDVQEARDRAAKADAAGDHELAKSLRETIGG